ncbi:MAG: flagellar basal-body rod protein FlgF [Rickettsiales bacterium]|mgnify:FL=1|nr:flagellar basal-body rod protein FlgF [Rickettsiales bacterium]
MDNSIYISLSGQLAQFRKMDVAANNIANADTTGFNSEHMMFTDYLVDDGNRNKMAFAQDISSYRNLSRGALNVTGNPFDMAISGPGYFQVETPQGVRYTKAGNFQLDPAGTLVTQQGFPVLSPDGQPIVFEQGDTNIRVGENGVISVNEGEDRGQVGVVEFADEQSMKRLNATLYETDQPALEQAEARLLHGTLEKSNVNAIGEMVQITKLSRATSSTAKFIEVMYDLERKTGNTYTKAGK